MVDAVFSFDSILTAIGLVDNVWTMIAAVVISMLIMMLFSGSISRFINKHPSLQVLALGFLIMIGVMLIAEGFHQHFNKAYIYSAIAFSLVIELINMRLRKNRESIKLNGQDL
jgi:predicted tellurium resistance membrane protein TerC